MDTVAGSNADDDDVDYDHGLRQARNRKSFSRRSTSSLYPSKFMDMTVYRVAVRIGVALGRRQVVLCRRRCGWCIMGNTREGRDEDAVAVMAGQCESWCYDYGPEMFRADYFSHGQ